jgi:adenosylcobinamide-phosphate synthase
VHPVARFGALMTRLEPHVWRDTRSAGAAYAALGVATGVAAGSLARSTALATYVACAGRALRAEASSVGASIAADDLDGARARLPALVGRDVDDLDEKAVARAVIESVAENTVDAVVAPALWAAAAGARGALAHRAINTLDAMVGHRDARYARFGWAAARADDAAAWVPARVTAALVAVVRPGAAGAVARVVRTDARDHPSPNAGVAEGAFAAALDLRLGGPLAYQGRGELRPSLGDGRPPEPADIGRAVRLSRDVTIALGAIIALTIRRPA